MLETDVNLDQQRLVVAGAIEGWLLIQTSRGCPASD
jgi:hypothetical protein